jgi:hypothetical protein
MSTILPTSSDKQQICLQYLGISARKFADAQGDYEESLKQLKTLHHYLDLALDYGCTEKQIMFALGYTRQRFDSLMRQVSR